MLTCEALDDKEERLSSDRIADRRLSAWMETVEGLVEGCGPTRAPWAHEDRLREAIQWGAGMHKTVVKRHGLS